MSTSLAREGRGWMPFEGKVEGFQVGSLQLDRCLWNPRTRQGLLDADVETSWTTSYHPPFFIPFDAARLERGCGAQNARHLRLSCSPNALTYLERKPKTLETLSKLYLLSPHGSALVLYLFSAPLSLLPVFLLHRAPSHAWELPRTEFFSDI